jgi:general secretion pathway protein H
MRPPPERSFDVRLISGSLFMLNLQSPRSRPAALRRRPPEVVSSGFTLLEILVVIVIIGVIVTAATVSIGVLGRDREMEDEARRLWAVLQQAREEAELQGVELGVFLTTNGYEFLRYNARRNQWIQIGDDAFYRARALPEGLRFRLWLDGREVVLKLNPPARAEKDADESYAPQIVVLSSGEVAPFELQIERDAQPSLWRVVSLPDNDLRVEQRAPRGDWTLVAQTREVEESDDG